MEPPDKFLRRYTNLPSLIYILSHKKITLLDPESWDDTNDSYFLSVYKKKKNLKTVLALCFAETAETYHHWKVFADGPSGACVNFYKDIHFTPKLGEKDLSELQARPEHPDLERMLAELLIPKIEE